MASASRGSVKPIRVEPLDGLGRGGASSSAPPAPAATPAVPVNVSTTGSGPIVMALEASVSLVPSPWSTANVPVSAGSSGRLPPRLHATNAGALVTRSVSWWMARLVSSAGTRST